MDNTTKLNFISSAITCLSDEYVSINGSHAELGQLPDFYLQKYAANKLSFLERLDQKNAELPIPFSKMVAGYNNFWTDLDYNLELERQPRSTRPPRKAT